MAQKNAPNMSLMAQYDDLCRYTKVLTAGCEEEFKIFVENLLNYFKKWKESEAEMQKMREKLSRLEADKGRLETQIKFLKNVCLEAENKKRKIEMEKNSLERQIELIKELLLADGVMDNQTKEKLGFLSSCKRSSNSPTRLETIEESTGSMLSISDVDRTEDDLISDKPMSNCNARQSKGKRSSSDGRFAQKKKKVESLDLEPTSDENEINNMPQKKLTVRCNSEPASTSPESEIAPRSFLKSDSTYGKNVPYELRKSSSAPLSVGTPNARYSTSGKLSRQHIFVSKVLYRPEKCNPCRNNIGFFNQALKCQDCTVICHPECKDKCPVPCIPIVHTPTEKTTGTIADYTSAAAPMIPPLIVYCVNEIESRGLGERGLYRVSGSDREVKILKEKFLNGRSIPLLHRHDINAICSTIKEFLRSLSEPLVTRSAWQEFVQAADIEDISKSLKAMYDIVCSLPQPNRDTLAFLVLHLQRVAASPECKMPISSLAKIFGPTIIGYSVPDPAELNVLRETKDQCKVMERLLSIPPESWNSLLNIEPDVFTYSLKKTPENTPAPRGTRLGPFATSGQRIKSTNLIRTPLSSRNSRYNKSGKMSFTSPIMK